LWALIQGNVKFFIQRDQSAIEDVHYVLKLALAAIPAGLIGFLLKDWLEANVIAQGLWPIGIALYVTALFLFLVQKRSVTSSNTKITYVDALVIGLFQVVALLPGISRSGSTLVGGFYRKIELHALIEFSFLLYLPIAFFSMLLELTQVETMDHPIGPLLLSFVMSGLFTYWALRWFVGLVQKGQLKYFGFYCIGAGSFAILLSLIGF
jgi:undecaprenyl-diphosphatase